MTPVRLTFLGSGDAFSSGGRLQTCLLLDGADEPMLLDCGATSLVALKRAGVDPATIGAVALSHLHGDHYGGIPWLVLDGQFGGRTRPLRLGGPPGTRQRIARAFEALYPGAGDAERAFDVHIAELAERVASRVGPADVTPYEVRHPSGAPAYALRVRYGGRVIAYSGDAEWTDALLEVADGADLFVCECNFFDRQAPGHLNYRTLSAKRAQLRCRRLVMTHMSAEMLDHLADVEIEAAHDGLALEV